MQCTSPSLITEVHCNCLTIQHVQCCCAIFLCIPFWCSQNQGLLEYCSGIARLLTEHSSVLLTLKQAVHSPERQAGNHVLVDNDTGAVLLRCMAQVLAQEAPRRAERPALQPWSPDMHFQAEESCHPRTQAVPCTSCCEQKIRQDKIRKSTLFGK